MQISVKYYVTDGRGSYIDWTQRVNGYGSVSPGELLVRGGAGDDTISLQTGTSADLTDLSLGNDRIYLTGNLADYTQSIDQDSGVYTLTRTAGLSNGQHEVVSFTVATDNDVIYFADGHVVLNGSSDANLFDGSNFLPISVASMQAGGTGSGPVLTTAIAPPSTPDRVYLADSAGVTLPLQEQPGQSLKVFGSAGDDSVYVKAGTSVDATDLSLGNDRLYLTGKLSDYSQAIDQGTGVYTLTRSAGLPSGQIEVVKFTVGDENDVVYFADGHIVINGATNSTLFDQSTGMFLDLSYQSILPGPTPGLNPKVLSADDPASDTTVLLGGTLDVVVNFDQPLMLAQGKTVTVIAQIGLSSGGTQDVTLTATGDSNTANANGVSSLHFRAALPGGLTDTDGIVLKANSLALGTATASEFTGISQESVLTTFSAIPLAHQLVDTIAPTLTITDDNVIGAVNAEVTYTFTFSEDVKGFDISDVTVAHGTKGTFTKVDAHTYTLGVTPTANTEGADIGVSVGTGLTDLAGNAIAAVTNAPAQPYDTLPPTVAITADKSALKSGETALVSFTFSEVPVGFEKSDIAVTGGTLTGFAVSSSDPKLYTATFTPTSGTTSTATLHIGDGAFSDDTGNDNLDGSDANNTLSIAVDTQAPTATIVMADTALKVGETSLVTVTFSEVVTGFDKSDLTAENGTLSTFSSTDGGMTWTGTFTPDAAIEDATNVITLAASSLTDVAGNANVGSTVSSNYTIDTKAPTLLISDDKASGAANTPVLYTFTFSEDVTGFDASDITVAHGTKGAFTTVNPHTYTLSVTPPANEQGVDLGVSVGTSLTDLAGNAPAAATTASAQAYDTLAPTVAISSDKLALKAGETALVTFTFSEEPVGFTVSDVAVTGGQLNGFSVSSTDPKVYTATFTPTAGTQATASLSIGSGTFSDATGNNNQDGADANNQLSIAVDNVAPTLVITDDNVIGAVNAEVIYTFTFSEDVKDFDISDVTVVHGTKGTFTVVDAHTYTLGVTPPANEQGADLGVSVGTGLTDLAGNPIAAVTTASIQAYDTLPPTVAISSNKSSLHSGETALISFTFSEVPVGFASSDIAVTGGKLGVLSVDSQDPKLYTATFTPTAGLEGTATLHIGTGAFSDDTGNDNIDGNDANNTVSIAVDTAPPTLPVTTYSAPENQTNVATLAGVDGSAITYSLAGSGADNAKFNVSSTGVLSFVTAPDFETPGSAAGTNQYSVTLLLSDANGNTSNQAISVNVTDVNDAPTLDVPLADQKAAAGESLSFSVPAGTFSDVDSPVLTYSATLANGTALPSWLTFNASTRTFSGTPSSSDLGTLSLKVVASDGSLTASDTFDLLVKSPTHIVSVLSDAPQVNGTSTVNSTDVSGLVTFTVMFGQELDNAANALGASNFVLVGADGVTPYSTQDNFAYDVALDTSDTTHRSYVVKFFVGGVIDESQVHLKFVADPSGTGAVIRDSDHLSVLDHLALANESLSATTLFTQNVDTDVPSTDNVSFTGAALGDGMINASEASGVQHFTLSHAVDATKLEIYANDGTTLLGTANGSNGWAADIDLSALTLNLDSNTGTGRYEFALKQYDDGGNVGSGTYGMNFDAKALEAKVTSDVSSVIGAGNFSGAAGAQVFTLSGSAQEAGTVTVAWDQGNDGVIEVTHTAVASAPGSAAWSVDFTKAELQAHTGTGAFKVSFTDAYGNTTPIATQQLIYTDVVI